MVSHIDAPFAEGLYVNPNNSEHNLALTRQCAQERSIFRAAKELFRFVMTTIVVANASKCTANAASIIANYHRTAAARNSRKSTDANGTLPSRTGVRENNINLWHFRTFSTCSAASPFETDLHDSVFATSGRRTRGSNASKDVAVVTSRSRAVKTVNDGRNTRGHVSSVDEYYDAPPSLDEMRAQLGPVGLIVANAVEVVATTASSYISGGIFGYMIGGAMGIPGVFRNQAASGPPGFTHLKSASPHAGLKDMQRRLVDWNAKALLQGKSWGTLSASFSGFHALARVCRGGVEDRWNSIISSAATGAYLSRQGGPQAMLQGASTYAGFTYVLDQMFGSRRDATIGGERGFEFMDTPVEDRGY
eukprot:CAMPEP_0176499646 /NCGR_PEP_ID=MMETSP0200_2-20121128/13050_1 /TAXON_ID=947934 /ORGANISM="Chaetoceros sp., Strain GSL56" /LENGTH=361 /DNA_ID=CAMNT_0017898103 /DNA_START=150 /DNA_END=1235 /DNA_ORIENTATION=+